MAVTISPNFSSGTATATASRTVSWSFSASSTSSGKTFSPPVLMHTEPRPRSVIVPSSSIWAKSPGSEYRTPSMTGNVAADLTSSL